MSAKFHYLYWHWTTWEEDLAKLSAKELAIFKDFVHLAESP